MGPKSMPKGPLLTGLGGLLLLIGSFLPFYKVPVVESSDELDFGSMFGVLLDTSWKVWSDAWSMFPIVPVAIILLLLLSTVVALPSVTAFKAPEKVFGQQFDQFAKCTSLLAIATIINYTLRNFVNSTTGWEIEAGSGTWVIAVGAALVVVGIFTGSSNSLPAPDLPPSSQATQPPTNQSGFVIDTKIRNIGLLIGLSGLVLGTFLKMVGTTFGAESGDETINGWSDGARPVYLWGAVIVMTFTIISATYRFNPDARVAVTGQSLRITQINLSVYALLHALTLLLGNFAFGGLGGMIDPAIGVYVSLIASIVLVVASTSRPN